MTAPPDDIDLHAAIAALRAERDAALSEKAALTQELAARTAELLERKTQFNERIEYQAATNDVLKAMSASPGDPQPVFDLIVERARDLCDAYGVTVLEFDGGLLHYRAANGVSDDAETREAFAAMYPKPPTRDMPQGRAILDRRTIRIDDLEADQGLNPFYRGITAKSTVVVPLMRGEVAIGTVGIGGRERGGFSGSQIELLQTFAEQAVIAITSAETYRALQTRTADLQETLEYQTATSDVLKVISRSTFDLQPVLETVAETAARLCGADQAAIYRCDGDSFQLVTNFGWPPEYETRQREVGRYRVRANSPGIPHQAIITRRAIHIHDVTTVPEYPEVAIELGKERTGLGVPLLREGEAIGVIVLARQRAEPFTDRQIALVNTFADQAVIAIENTRLLTEQREALEQQTATAEVLQVINASPGHLAPVFDVVLEKAIRLCDSAFGTLTTYDGSIMRCVATRGLTPEQEALLADRPPATGLPTGRIADGEEIVHLLDARDQDGYRAGFGPTRYFVDQCGARTAMWVALRKEKELLGILTIFRREVRAFTDKEIALVQNFAAQAVIAMENARLLTEQQEALEQQTATAEVLQVINASPGNLSPVFDAMLEKAMRLCGATYGHFRTYDGEGFPLAAVCGDPSLVELHRQRMRYFVPGPHNPISRFQRGEDLIHISDAAASEAYGGDPGWRELVDTGACRSVLAVALRKDTALLGYISVYRREVRSFSDKEIALLENFAAQAVIAMENARLLTEQQEALEQQTATAEVLQVINASPGDLTPVFDAILDKAHRLCDATMGALVVYDGEHFRALATHGFPPQYAALIRQPYPPNRHHLPLLRGERFIHVPDIRTIGVSDHEVFRHLVENTGARTLLIVPLRKDGSLLGTITAYRLEVRPYSDKEIALLENFAAQAAIAMENARLLDEIRQRQEELRVTFENMGDGVAMFDETQHLVAWNRKFQDILDVPDDIIARRQTFTEYVRYLAQRGEYGPETNPEEHVRRLIEQAGQSRTYERTRPDGRVIEIRHNPVAGGGFVLIYADITERKRSEEEIRAARDAAEIAYRELKTAQANLIQAEKMASLGQLTAGIAHEIKNPLNFVNNFAALSVDLLGELKDAIAPAEPALTDKQRVEVEEVSAMLTSNLEKITEHGKRADGIVKAMLEHSRGSSGERRTVDLNALIDEALNLAYHGARAQDQSFNVTLERDFGEGISPIEVNPQDMTRVFLNIFSNGFYAATRRARNGGDAGFVPTLKVATRDTVDAVEIRVRDNGTGVPADIKDRVFQPFFTTKPTGEGTGLGLSITYDIVTQQHGGTIAADSNVGEYSEFTIRLPRRP